MINEPAYQQLTAFCSNTHTTLVAVSKTKPAEDIMALYELGQRDFGENYVQELVEKQTELPKDIHWHFIGHLQSNKVKQIISFVHLIHSIDSVKLLEEVNKQAAKINRKVDCLLQMHIAQEETKYGMNEMEMANAMQQKNTLSFINVQGLMGMASFTGNAEQIKSEFTFLKNCYDRYFTIPDTLSMGMSSDYELAVTSGSNMIRIGSMLFGSRK